MEALRLRVQDLDLQARQLTVRSGKGTKPTWRQAGGGGAADGLGKDVPECGLGMGVAVGLPTIAPLA